ncbi:MAG TPA: bifunctional nuclease family protein [Candidatus Atribacteria bacterium]|nr:bifunctional nuclease family protein [Candidatus Atribacteria bacterium]HPU08356.1 bifunctional nuclease family protein [Candidatus Atribacteria bacterium]HQE25495.1 bifunctional nuclease family protein [Candidatus Atribacteria bacterium]
MTKMKIQGLMFDQKNAMAVVILTDEEEKRSLPIWIGLFEAQAILLGLQGVKTPRPLTHDLMASVIRQLGGELEKIVITKVVDNTFYALLYIRINGNEITIDARPSDGIALSLRMGAPIFISKEVLSSTTVAMGEIDDKEIEEFSQFLDHLKPEDLKKYLGYES